MRRVFLDKADSVAKALRLESEIDYYLAKIAQVVEPEGAGCSAQLLVTVDNQRAAIFLRLLLALMWNAAQHAEYGSPIRTVIQFDEAAKSLRVQIMNKPSLQASDRSKVGISTRGVANLCLKLLQGGKFEFPAQDVRTTAVSAFEVPSVYVLEGKATPWISLK